MGYYSTQGMLVVWKERKTTQDTESKADLYRELSHTREAAIVNRGKENKAGDKDERFYQL